ncbi:hypothetical protein PLESTF_001691800 [Pleodorina starrii]|nr:hypothetical protein PLESTF_001691800 [Pleodorina starrii]
MLEASARGGGGGGAGGGGAGGGLYTASAYYAAKLYFRTAVQRAVKLYFPWIGHLRVVSALEHSWRGLMWAEFQERAFQCGPDGSPDMRGTGALGLYPHFIPSDSRYGDAITKPGVHGETAWLHQEQPPLPALRASRRLQHACISSTSSAPSTSAS